MDPITLIAGVVVFIGTWIVNRRSGGKPILPIGPISPPQPEPGVPPVLPDLSKNPALAALIAMLIQLVNNPPAPGSNMLDHFIKLLESVLRSRMEEASLEKAGK